MFSIPARLDGLIIPNPSAIASKEYEASLKVTAALVEAVCQQSGQLDYSTVVQQMNSKSEVRKEKREVQSAEARRIRPLLSQSHQTLLDMSSKKGSSSCMSCISPWFLPFSGIWLANPQISPQSECVESRSV